MHISFKTLVIQNPTISNPTRSTAIAKAVRVLRNFNINAQLLLNFVGNLSTYKSIKEILRIYTKYAKIQQKYN